MQMWLTLVVLFLIGESSSAVSNAGGEDVSEYWADEFKASKHLYARTSDKDLYGETLPPTFTYNAPSKLRDGGLKKTKHYTPDLSEDATNLYETYSKSEEHPIAITKQTVNKANGHRQQVYLKPLDNESLNINGFKPYFVGANESNAYDNLQDVLSTSSVEKSIGTVSDEIAEDNRIYATNKARSKVRFLRGNGLQSRTKCRAGICRKKAKTTNRLYSRPTNRIKKIVYNY